MRILLVEDVRKLAAYIRKGLEAQGYSIDCAYDGQEAEDRALAGVYDCVVLDLMLPGKDGISVCRTLREKGIATPVLMLTARGEVEDRIQGLDVGADDYLVKPFDFDELLARIRALLRRPPERLPEVIEVRDITINYTARSVKRDGEELDLSKKEYLLLEFLARNKNIVLSREQILAHCWGWDIDSYSNVVDVYIKKLRRKLDPANQSGYIKTIRGVGYTIEE